MLEPAPDENGAGLPTDPDTALDDPIVEDATPVVGLGDYARYALEVGWDPIPLHGVTADGACTCRRGPACPSAGKHPVDSEWEKKPRITVQDTYAIWDMETRPRNVGLRTGRPSGFFVVDIDPKHDGDKRLAELEAQYGPLPQTRIHETGSTGDHHLFLLPDDFEVTNSRGRLPRGIDVRGTGGFVVAPGSVSGVGPYRTRDYSPIGPAPEWLLDLLRPVDHTTIVLTEADGVAYADLDESQKAVADKYLRAAVDAELARLDAMREAATRDLYDYRGEPWDSTTYEVACNLLELAQSPWTDYGLDDVKRDLREHAPTDAGFTITDVMGKLASAANTVRGKARPAPDGIKADDTWDLLTAGLPSQPSAPSAPGSGWDKPEFSRPKQTDDREDDPLFRKVKNGGFAINATTFRDYLFDGRDGVEFPPLAVDAGGSIWVYSEGVYMQHKGAISGRAQVLLGDYYTPAAKSLARDLIVDSGRAPVIDFNEARHPDLINFRNGMLNWRTGELEDHDPAHLSTSQMTFEWDPDAECPKFSHYVDTMLSPEAAALLWQVIGYTLLSGNPMQVVIYFVGRGGNGKGVVLRALTGMLGAHNVSSLTLLEIDGDNRFKLSSLVGKAANISGETTGGYIKESVNLKRASGNDFLDMERKGQDSFQAKVPATLIFSINETPHFADDSDGLMQRGVVIPFDRKVVENHIPGFSEAAFVKEYPGIARRGIEAVRAVDMDSPDLRAKGFALIRDAQAKFEQDTNAELYWLSNHVRPKRDHFVTPNELWRAFGGKSPRASRKFMRTLRALYGDPVRRTPSRLASIDPSKSARQDCYEVEYSEDPYRVRSVADDFFGEARSS